MFFTPVNKSEPYDTSKKMYHARRVKSEISISPQYVYWEVLRSFSCCSHVINHISDVSSWGGSRESYYLLLFLAWKNSSLYGSTQGRPMHEFSRFWRFFKDSARTSTFHGSRPAEVVAHHYSEDNHEKIWFSTYVLRCADSHLYFKKLFCHMGRPWVDPCNPNFKKKR